MTKRELLAELRAEISPEEEALRAGLLTCPAAAPETAYRKSATSAKPSAAAMIPACVASSPTVGETEVSARIVSGAGRAPALSSAASLLAEAASKRPVISPREPISSLMTGAEMSVSSRMIAS